MILKHWIRNTVDKTMAEDAVKILDSNKEGVEKMVANNAFMIEEMKEKVKKETEREVRKQEEELRKQDKIEIAKNLLDTLDDEIISLKVGLTINEVKKLRADRDSKAYN